jgi:TPR repeat protein
MEAGLPGILLISIGLCCSARADEALAPGLGACQTEVATWKARYALASSLWEEKLAQLKRNSEDHLRLDGAKVESFSGHVAELHRQLHLLRTRIIEAEAEALRAYDRLIAANQLYSVSTRYDAQRPAARDVLETGSLGPSIEEHRQSREASSPADPRENNVQPTASKSLRSAPAADGRQIAKAEELLRQGDVSGARLLLEHASRQGSAVASFKLAETYDPGQLKVWRVVGVRGDVSKARELYTRAYMLGVDEARGRAEALL